MKRSLLAVLALAALAGAWWALREPPRTSVPKPSPPEDRTEPLRESPSSSEPAAASDAQLETPAEQAAPESTARSPQVWSLRGSVVRAGLAESDAELTFDVGPAGCTARTGNLGLFEVALPLDGAQPGGFAHCTVRDSLGRPCFDGIVRLDQDVALELREHITVRGQVMCSVPRTDELLKVELFEPALRARRAPRRLASLVTDALGNFECDVLLHDPHETLLAEIELSAGANPARTIARVGHEVRVDELASAAGAVLRLDVTRVSVFVASERGDPLRAFVTWPDLGAKGFDPERVAPNGGWTDGQGTLEVTAASGTLELAARAEGHAPRRLAFQIQGSSSNVELRLRELRSTDELFGTVLFPDGRPAHGARVSVSSGFALSRGRWTVAQSPEAGADADGSFRFAIDAQEPVELNATHAEGMSGPWSATPQDSPLVLTLAPYRALTVSLDADALPTLNGSGELDYVAHQRESGRAVWGTAESAPFEIVGLAPGLWDIYVVAPGMSGAGTATADLGPWAQSAAPRASVVVPLAPAHWVDARLAWRSGEPIANCWVFARGNWPEAVWHVLGAARTDSAGRARAFCDTPRATLAFWPESGSAEPREAELLCDQPAEIVVD